MPLEKETHQNVAAVATIAARTAGGIGTFHVQARAENDNIAAANNAAEAGAADDLRAIQAITAGATGATSAHADDRAAVNCVEFRVGQSCEIAHDFTRLLADKRGFPQIYDAQRAAPNGHRDKVIATPVFVGVHLYLSRTCCQSAGVTDTLVGSLHPRRIKRHSSCCAETSSIDTLGLWHKA